MSKKQYCISGVDQINQKEKTEKKRYIINTAISVVSAVAAIIGSAASIIVLFKG